MPNFNQSDFFTIRQLDLENKLFLPSAKLYDQVNLQLTAAYEDFRFQINNLYLDICKALSETQSTLTSTALDIYERPTETFSGWYAQATNTAVQAYERPIEALSVWYDQATSSGVDLYAKAQTTALSTYQNWQVQLVSCKDKTGQYLQTFWENPQQVALSKLEPVTHYLNTSAEQSQLYVQNVMDNLEQLPTAIIAQVIHHISAMGDSTEAFIISSFYTLADFARILADQPSATLHVLYNNTLANLLDVYFNIISSLLVAL